MPSSAHGTPLGVSQLTSLSSVLHNVTLRRWYHYAHFLVENAQARRLQAALSPVDPHPPGPGAPWGRGLCCVVQDASVEVGAEADLSAGAPLSP